MKPTETSPAKILIVEDELLIVLSLENILSSNGYDVMGPFAGAASALRKLEDEIPAAAILDINIQDGTSFAVADALSEKGCPYLFLTGRDNTSLPPAYADHPILTKPAFPHQILAELQRLLGRRKKSGSLTRRPPAAAFRRGRSRRR